VAQRGARSTGGARGRRDGTGPGWRLAVVGEAVLRWLSALVLAHPAT
jgi:hypothetical protein